MTAIGDKKLNRWHLQIADRWIVQYNLYINDQRWGRILYRLPVIPRCGRVNRQAYHVWGMEDAGILFSQRTGGGRAAALGTTRERACLPAGSDDREHARGDGAWGSGAAGWAEPVSGLRMA